MEWRETPNNAEIGQFVLIQISTIFGPPRFSLVDPRGGEQALPAALEHREQMGAHRFLFPRQVNVPISRTDNYLKNHFYSKLRKALRHLNKIIKCYFKREFKEIKIGTVYKIIEGFEEQFKEKPHVAKEVSLQCCQLKDALIQFADASQEMEERTESHQFVKERTLVQSIVEFSRNYRKKSKKEKRESLQVEELFKPAKRIDLMPREKQEDENSEF